VGSEDDTPDFRVWEGNAGPPSHSIPPHQVAKAAAQLGTDAFERIHERLLRAYFCESLDVTDTDTLQTLWREVGLPDDAFATREDPAFVKQIIEEHNESIGLGVTGVPAVRLANSDIAIVGAQPIETYRRWIERQLAAERSEPATPQA
jgi:predicted DsbA family dithiol-disulfide isomerase